MEERFVSIFTSDFPRSDTWFNLGNEIRGDLGAFCTGESGRINPPRFYHPGPTSATEVVFPSSDRRPALKPVDVRFALKKTRFRSHDLNF
jgi:hypothetical protein